MMTLHLKRHLLLLIAGLLNWQISHAQALKPFNATFKVKVFFFHVGYAHQSLSCDLDAQCQLTNEARPIKWAEDYIDESVKEWITLNNQPNGLIWQGYHKHLTRKKKDRTIVKETQLFVKENQVQHASSDKTWPASSQAFDQISLVYGIQSARLNQKPLTGFLLQDEKDQFPLHTKGKKRTRTLDLPIGDDIKTEHHVFYNGIIRAEVWLAPKWDYFPVQVKIKNEEKNRTVTLELSKLKFTP